MSELPKPSDDKKETVTPPVPPAPVETVTPREQELLNRLEQEADARKKAEIAAAHAIDERDTLRRVQSERPSNPAPKPAAASGFGFFRS